MTISRLTGIRLLPEYVVWKSMRTRCNNPNTLSWKRYGGRGIKVCERWNSYDTFLSDMGQRPSPNHTLDRRDNAQGYDPSNCRWATRKEQSENTRRNRWITAFGKTRTIIEWEKTIGVSHGAILRRLSLGAAPEQALSKTLRVFECVWNVDGAKVKAIRERCGLNQREASKLAGLSFNFWNMIERGQYGFRSKLSIVEKIAKGLGCVREDFTIYQPIRFESQ